MFDFGLPIFPVESSAITVSTTVWVGVFVCVFFHLRLGWTLSGLVVPGYLVPLMMTRPITACVILFEALLTYLIVLALSESPRKLPYWSGFFGRDRFFVILIVSVLLRAILDGFALPWIGQYAVEKYDLNIDYRNNLHSFGLIVVALIANYFWKPGVVRGFPPLMTCVIVTYLLIRYVIVELTNFNVGNFHALYEDITTSLMSSPKSYIILITTAYLASWINLRYAWDFNGILIPSLIGLLWHDPAKILVSGLECILLCVVGSYLMKAPPLRNLTIQGSRKIIFFFTICYAYRLLVSHCLPLVLPDAEITDAFGFGYLLTTLMAIKIHDKKNYLRMLRATGEVSVIGAVAGSLIGFAFFCGPQIDFGLDTAMASMVDTDPTVEVERIDQSIQQMVRSDKVLLYEKQRPGSYQPPLPTELRTFRVCLRQLNAVGRELDMEQLIEIAKTLRTVNYELLVVADRYLYLRERSPVNGWGIYVLDLHRDEGIGLEVPAPMDEWGTVESGLVLLQHLPIRGLAIAGTPRRINYGHAADVTQRRQTMLEVFHQEIANRSAIQIRGYTDRMLRAVERSEPENSEKPHATAKTSRLYLRGSVPPQLKLSQLKSLAGSLAVRWSDSPTRNVLRGDSELCFAELILSIEDRRRLFRRMADEYRSESGTTLVSIFNSPLAEWLNSIKANILPMGANQYVPARIEEMRFMDQEVVEPLLQLLSQVHTPDLAVADAGPHPLWLTDSVMRRLIPIDASARALGYQLTVIRDRLYGESYVALSEIASPNLRGWGTFVFRPGMVDAFGVEIPRPLFERRSFDFGVNLFNRPRSSALLIAGTHPRANPDGSSDISHPSNRANLFNLVRHVLLRHLGDRPFLITQARAIQAPVEADIVVATDDGSTSLGDQSLLKTDLLSVLANDHLELAFVKGQPQTAGYELGILMKAMAIQVSQNKEIMSLWLSPSLRTHFRAQSENHAATAQFDACGIPSVRENLLRFLFRQYASHRDSMVGDEIPHQLKEQLRQYVQTRDVVQLYGICRSNSDWQLTRLLDGASGQAYLLIARDKNRFPTILNLTGSVSDRAVTIDALDRRAVGTFIRSRARWLQPRSSGDGLHQSSPLLVLHGGSTGQSKGANIDPLAVGLTTDPQVEVGRE